MTSRIRPLPRNLSRHLLSGPAAIVTTGVFVGLLVLVLWSLSDGVAPTEGQTPPVPKFDRIQSGSTTASAVVELNLTIESMPMDATSGSSVELYLEDDFQVPDSIDRNAVYFTAANPFPPTPTTAVQSTPPGPLRSTKVTTTGALTTGPSGSSSRT